MSCWVFRTQKISTARIQIFIPSYYLLHIIVVAKRVREFLHEWMILNIESRKQRIRDETAMIRYCWAGSNLT